MAAFPAWPVSFLVPLLLTLCVKARQIPNEEGCWFAETACCVNVKVSAEMAAQSWCRAAGSVGGRSVRIPTPMPGFFMRVINREPSLSPRT